MPCHLEPHFGAMVASCMCVHYEPAMTVLYMQSKDAEQMLWRTVFYTVIEEFRRRIKAATAQGQKGSEPLRKVPINISLVSECAAA